MSDSAPARQFSLFCRALLAAAFLLVSAARLPGQELAATPFREKPKIRAITAFINLDRTQYRQQVAETLAFLRSAKKVFEQGGYEVQSIRVTTQPFPQYTQRMTTEQAVAFFKEYDALAEKEGFDASIGPAMANADDSEAQADLLAEILRTTKVLNASVVVAGEDGVRWKAVGAAARLVKKLSETTEHSQGNFKFAAAALVPQFTPFYPASNHAGFGRQFAVALQSANVVAEVLRNTADLATARRRLTEALGNHAFAIQALAEKVDKQSGWTYSGIDLSPAPLKDVSIGAAVENLTAQPFGASGTLTAAATITAAIKDIAVKQAGYSGLMVPVLEDARLAQRWSEGRIGIDALLAYSAVCGTGLDTIPLPGDISVERLQMIIGDMASLAVKWHKPLSARLLPVAGKKPGDKTEFDDPFLVNATLQGLEGGNPSVAESQPEGREAEVRAAMQNFVEAFKNLDWERFRNTLADNVTVFFPDQIVTRIDGRAAVEEHFRRIFEESRGGKSGPPYLDIEPKDLQIQLNGNSAVATFHLENDPQFSKRRTIVWNKIGGTWKIVHMHASQVRM